MVWVEAVFSRGSPTLPPSHLFPWLTLYRVEQSVSAEWVSSANWLDQKPSFGRLIFCQAGHCASWCCGRMVATSDAREESGERVLLSMVAHGFSSLGVTLYWISGLVPGFWSLVSGFNIVICYAIHAGLVFSLQKHWTVTANKLWNCISLYEGVFVFTYYVWLQAKMNTVKVFWVFFGFFSLFIATRICQGTDVELTSL